PGRRGQHARWSATRSAGLLRRAHAAPGCALPGLSRRRWRHLLAPHKPVSAEAFRTRGCGAVALTDRAVTGVRNDTRRSATARAPRPMPLLGVLTRLAPLLLAACGNSSGAAIPGYSFTDGIDPVTGPCRAARCRPLLHLLPAGPAPP